MRTADIYVFGKLAGALTENDDGKFSFLYDEQYQNDSSAVAVSCTMPLRSEAYVSDALFPFFDGLIPEGWLLDIAASTDSSPRGGSWTSPRRTGSLTDATAWGYFSRAVRLP